MREKKSLVNDRLSPTSLILVRKVTGNEFVFLCDPVFMLDKLFGTSIELFGMSSDILCFIIGPLRKILALSGSKCHSYKFKKVGRQLMHSLVSFNSTYFPVSNTR